MAKKETGILKDLLQINIERLKVCVEMEKKNNFVYPEGTAITKTILSIEEEIYMRENPSNVAQGKAKQEVVEPETALAGIDLKF